MRVCLALVSWVLVLASPAFAQQPDSAPPDPLSDEAIRTFAREFETAVNRKLTALFDHLDVPATIRRGVADLELPEEPLAEVIRDLDQRVRPPAEAGDAPATATARLLRVLRVGGEPVLRFRYLAEGVPDYADYWLAAIDGKLRIVDVLRHSRGAHMSAQMRMSVLGMLRQRGAGLPAAATADMDLLQQFSEVAGAMQRRDPVAARQLYAQLPDAAFTHPTIRHSARTLPCGLALVEGGPEAYARAIADVRETRGTDLQLEAWALTVLLSVNAHELALPQLARVDALISDPWLDWCRARVLLQLTRLPAAREAALQAVDRDATLTEAWAWLLSESVERQAFSETVMLLTQVERATDQRPETQEAFRAVLEHAGFRASEEFRRWQASRPADDDDDDNGE